jgi:hypothetical protein
MKTWCGRKRSRAVKLMQAGKVNFIQHDRRRGPNENGKNNA